MSAAPRRSAIATAGLLAAVLACSVLGTAVRAQTKREFKVTAHKYAFTVEGQATPRIEVQQDDLVRITFSADDIPHSFTIDEYRIAKRAEPGKPSSFEFRADRLSEHGPIIFYCNLAIDDGCKRMRGELIVTRKR